MAVTCEWGGTANRAVIHSSVQLLTQHSKWVLNLKKSFLQKVKNHFTIVTKDNRRPLAFEWKQKKVASKRAKKKSYFCSFLHFSKPVRWTTWCFLMTRWKQIGTLIIAFLIVQEQPLVVKLGIFGLSWQCCRLCNLILSFCDPSKKAHSSAAILSYLVKHKSEARLASTASRANVAISPRTHKLLCEVQSMMCMCCSSLLLQHTFAVISCVSLPAGWHSSLISNGREMLSGTLLLACCVSTTKNYHNPRP